MSSLTDGDAVGGAVRDADYLRALPDANVRALFAALPDLLGGPRDAADWLATALVLHGQANHCPHPALSARLAAEQRPTAAPAGPRGNTSFDDLPSELRATVSAFAGQCGAASLSAANRASFLVSRRPASQSELIINTRTHTPMPHGRHLHFGPRLRPLVVFVGGFDARCSYNRCSAYRCRPLSTILKSIHGEEVRALDAHLTSLRHLPRMPKLNSMVLRQKYGSYSARIFHDPVLQSLPVLERLHIDGNIQSFVPHIFLSWCARTI